MAVDLFSEDLDKYDNEGKYSALRQFCASRLSEGWRLDYAEVWDDRTLEKIAAFANTFGGVLIIGVKKDKGDTEPVLIGVNSAVEYKTRIASSIAANISPVPSYYIYECHKPGEPNSKFCVVQVRNVNSFHLLTKKNIKPIHVRNEDETREADAADIRRLLERNRLTDGFTAKLSERANETLRSLRVRSDRNTLDKDRESFTDSQSFLKIVLIPFEFRGSHLEKSHEDHLKRLIRGLYTRVQNTDSHATSMLTEDRDSTFFEWIWYHKNNNWEMRWRITAEGQIGHATQIRSGRENAWSAVDLCDFLFIFLRLSSMWWEEKRYFGDGVIFVDISTDSLPISQISQGAFGRLLNPSGGSRDSGYISSDAIRVSPTGRSRAYADQRISPVLGEETAIPTVASLTNTVLRNLGHLVDWHHLERSLRSLYLPSA
jgi:Putative DNA-binding domain